MPVILPAVKGSFRFRREEHLKKGSEIREVFKRGKRVACRGAKLFVLRNGLPRNRICFTFSRGFPGAVRRNRDKRLGREAYRALKPRLDGGYDLVFLMYPEDPGADRPAQLGYLLAKAGLVT